MAARTEVTSPPQNFEITREGAIAILTFVREDRLNALDHRTMQDLIDAFDELGRDDSVLVIVMTGRGKAFVAGADINGYLDIELLDYVNFQRLGRKMYASVEQNPKPVIAAVNGWALGGGFELVLVADIVIASERAKLGLPECKLGLLPGGGGRSVSPVSRRNKAKELLMMGEPITAADAERLGIVNKVVSPDDLMETTLAMARMIAERAPQAVQMAKQLINDGLEAPLETAITMETGMTATLYEDPRRPGRHQGVFRKAVTRFHRTLTGILSRAKGGPTPATVMNRNLAVRCAPAGSGSGIENFDLTVHAGEIVGLFGLLGAGINTVGRVLFGASERSGGSVELDGQPVKPNSPSDAMEKGMGLLTENRKGDGLVLPMSVRDNMTLASLRQFAKLSWLNARKETREATMYVDRLSVRTPSLRQRVQLLSGGNQQKVLMARWLMRDPKLLILAEPTRGIDVGSKNEIYRLMERWPSVDSASSSCRPRFRRFSGSRIAF